MKWRCLFRHDWRVHQYAVQAEGTGLQSGAVFVIAWKQCHRCAHSKLIHLLV